MKNLLAIDMKIMELGCIKTSMESVMILFRKVLELSLMNPQTSYSTTIFQYLPTCPHNLLIRFFTTNCFHNDCQLLTFPMQWISSFCEKPIVSSTKSQSATCLESEEPVIASILGFLQNKATAQLNNSRHIWSSLFSLMHLSIVSDQF